ncbi:hypothetical protein [endosymbiont GvMRE of Glomus versiforme]|uniref:hypothetical protein n=1 Tax=endosymbiont GvMRE of Glomus versiforme TaxID=2039283 RepID=UPI000EC207F4|nr:hypothetical protein [endosymbiont GvMRE of Glomus versiforme]RHZ35679.1 hypothetical protein GvMRE_IIg498 [endosymbiont GvMRE of Glomus versiforme]
MTNKKNNFEEVFKESADSASKTRKNLYDWWYNGIDSNEKERLERIGINSSSSSSSIYSLSDLKKILKLEEVARSNKNAFSSEVISSILFFSTWFSPNCVLIINEVSVEEKVSEALVSTQDMIYNMARAKGEDFPQAYAVVNTALNSQSIERNVRETSRKYKNYRIRVVIFDSCFYNYPFVLRVGTRDFDSFNEVKSKAFSIMRDLNGDHPACAVLENTDEVFNLPFSGEIVGVKGFSLSFNRNEPERYIEPLDIIRVKKSVYFHAGIYLGKDDYGNHKIAHVTRNRAEIANWSELFNSSSSAVSYYHPFLPYKRPELIKEHIARAVSSKNYDVSYDPLFGASDYKKGNCHHFANRSVLGLNFSNEGSFFKQGRELREEIERTNSHFNLLNIKDYSGLNDVRTDIEKYMQIADYESYEDRFENYVEVNSNCKLQ